MFDGACRRIPRFLDLSAYTGGMIAKGISKTRYLLVQMLFQKPFALHNFAVGFGLRKSIELRVAVTMPAALYSTCVDFAQLVPGEHWTSSLPLALQPATRTIDKGSSNVKCCRKTVPSEYK